jgi:tRNA U34 2-thiouridine synthase MnmA/TrmU
LDVRVKIRYKSEEAPAVLYPRADGALVCFDQPQRAVTPGQAAVFYQGDTLLGGGIIEADTPKDEMAFGRVRETPSRDGMFPGSAF